MFSREKVWLLSVRMKQVYKKREGREKAQEERTSIPNCPSAPSLYVRGFNGHRYLSKRRTET